MLSDYLKKPDSSEYYLLTASNKKNYFFLSLETAKRVIEIKRADISRTEYTLFKVNEKNLTKEVIDTIRKREEPIDREFLIKEKVKKDLSWLDEKDDLNEMLKGIAEEENRIPRRK